MNQGHCGMCRKRAPRPGLRTCQVCADDAKVRTLRRWHERRAAIERDRRAGKPVPCSRCMKEPPRAGHLTCARCAEQVNRSCPVVSRPPSGFRRSPRLPYAVTPCGRRVVRFSKGTGWRPVDLTAAPLVRRASAALAVSAWGLA